ncbi:hypothetical protein J2X76_004651 [Neorhizobium sp. 2083]|uniref:hypothetical protein n=1 Tax=Neorhizobium sp. 2083 TaxID=2817762 RepID=UPI00285DC1D2|nr:hypothetical protein [Neorhizobium sp. 2083]MDR6819459.1 hypothetical protein [Neorhizobium sp. 2083]
MIANHMKPVFLAAALFATVASAADARDRWSDTAGSIYRIETNRDDPAPEGEFYRIVYTGSASFVRRLGIFSGALQAPPPRDFGIYITRGYWPGDAEGGATLAPKAKIIDVDGGLRGHAFAADGACSFESGVCVIRGGN